MKRKLLILLALTTIVVGTSCSTEMQPVADESELPFAVVEVAPDAPKERKTAVRILTTGGVCSATKLAPQTILSASHCFRTATRLIIVNNEPAIIERVVQDGNDHALVLMSEITLEDFATLAPAPKEGDNIHYWGSPYVFSMLLRRGYVSGFDELKTIYDANGYHGDSGAGVFNSKNQLVAVISYIHGKESFAMMGSYPLNFTDEQLASVGLAPNPLLTTGVVVEVELNYSD